VGLQPRTEEKVKLPRAIPKPGKKQSRAQEKAIGNSNLKKQQKKNSRKKQQKKTAGKSNRKKQPEKATEKATEKNSRKKQQKKTAGKSNRKKPPAKTAGRHPHGKIAFHRQFPRQFQWQHTRLSAAYCHFP